MSQVVKAFGSDPKATDETKQMMEAFMRNMPLRAIAMTSEGKLSLANLDRLIAVLNATALKAKRG